MPFFLPQFLQWELISFSNPSAGNPKKLLKLTKSMGRLSGSPPRDTSNCQGLRGLRLLNHNLLLLTRRVLLSISGKLQQAAIFQQHGYQWLAGSTGPKERSGEGLGNLFTSSMRASLVSATQELFETDAGNASSHTCPSSTQLYCIISLKSAEKALPLRSHREPFSPSAKATKQQPSFLSFKPTKPTPTGLAHS